MTGSYRKTGKTKGFLRCSAISDSHRSYAHGMSRYCSRTRRTIVQRSVRKIVLHTPAIVLWLGAHESQVSQQVVVNLATTYDPVMRLM